MKITELTPPERRMWRAYAAGGEVDFRQEAGEDAEEGGAWGPERTVRAEVIRALLLSGEADDGEIPALRLMGARVTGLLNLQYGTVEHALRMWGCHFERPPLLYGARLRQLNLSESYLPALDAATVHVDGVLRITDCRIPGEVRLGGAEIAAMFLERARLGTEDTYDEAVLQLNHATVDDDLWAPGLVVHGRIRLTGATIAGAANLTDATLTAPGRVVLDAETLTIGNNLVARGLRTEGRIDLRGATVPGKLDLGDARLSNPGGTALHASSCAIGELWLRRATPIRGTVNLRRSRIDVIDASATVWPESVKLNGLTYGTLTPALPAGQRLELLERDVSGYVPHAYEQLAAAYRRIGDDAGARTVQLAKQRRHRATLSWYARTWGYVQDATVGYGFRPTRAMGWLLALLLVGTVVYGVHHPRPVEAGKAPDFHSTIYTLDLLLPIIDFGQEKAFNPHGGYQWLAYLFIAAGWILATTVVAGITRAVNRQ